MFSNRFLRIILIIIFSIVYTNLSAQYEEKKREIKSKLLIFKKQYESLKLEAKALSNKVQRMNISDNTKCSSIASEMASLNERIQIFAKGIMEYYSKAQEIFDRSYYFMQRLKHGTSAGKVKELDKVNLLFKTSLAMQNTIGMFAEFLFSKNTIYFKAALKYEEVWILLEKEIYL